jgi:hypothetical protein
MNGGQLAGETAQLYSIGTRSHYDWTPLPFLMKLLRLDSPLYISPPLPDSERKATIEFYPPISYVDYCAPATVPTAEKPMNKGQKLEGHSLKILQYVISAAFRPLDILVHKLLVNTEIDNPNLERHVNMIKDVRRLLLHGLTSMTQTRTNVALRVVNPSFVLKLTKQKAARKATREALNTHRRQHNNRRPFNMDNQFFRSGPSSQQEVR